MTYDDLLKIFYIRRRDYSFPSSELDGLTDKERKIIESLIIKSCLDGDSSCFQHLDKLKFYDPVAIFTDDVIQKMDSDKKVKILRILYEMTKNDKYIDFLINLAVNDLGAFSMLTIMLEDGEIDLSYLNSLIQICKRDSYNKNYYIKMLSRILSEKQLEQYGIRPMVHYHDDFGFNHDKAIYDMVTNKESTSGESENAIGVVKE